MPHGLPRLALPHRLFDRVERTAERWGIDPTDVVELIMAARLPAQGTAQQEEAAAAHDVVFRFDAGEAVDLDHLTQSLSAYRIGILRMGPIVPADVQRQGELKQVPREELELDSGGGGYPRRWIGMSVSDTPEEVWQAARGYWRLRPDLQYLVPSRFGYAPYVFKVGDWIRFSSTKFFVGLGWLVSPEEGMRYRMLEPEPGEHLPRFSEPEAASEADLAVARGFTGRLLRLGPRGTNPVIRL